MYSTPAVPILCILDDDASFCAALNRLFRSHGMRALVYPSLTRMIADHALEKADCLVFDVYLSDGNGLDFAESLFRTATQVPFIILSAYPDDKCRIRALKAGAAAYLEKPVKEQDLLRAVHKALTRRPAQPPKERIARKAGR